MVRSLRPLSVAFVAAWCILGAVAMVRGQAGTAGWRFRIEPAARAAVGRPMAGADIVTTVGELLAAGTASASAVTTSPEAWLVILPAGIDTFTLTYVRYQLYQTQYPLRVDAAVVGALPPSDGYQGLIAAPGLMLAGPWRNAGTHVGFTRYERVSP